MGTTQTISTVDAIIKAIQNHRFFDDEPSTHITDEQYRKDLDRATMTVQILLGIVPDISVTELSDTLHRAGFYTETVTDVMKDYPFIY